MEASGQPHAPAAPPPGKEKCVPMLIKRHAMKTYWVNGGIAPCVLNLGTMHETANRKPVKTYEKNMQHMMLYILNLIIYIYTMAV
jgi:hypothetical protein